MPLQPFLEVRISDTGLQGKMRRTNLQVRRFNSAMRDVNQRSLRLLMETSAANLERSVREHGRPQRRDSGKLAAVLRDIDNHDYNSAAFYFMILRRVNRKAKYYRVLEEGTQGFIGRRVMLSFIDSEGEVQEPSQARAAARLDVIYGGLAKKRWRPPRVPGQARRRQAKTTGAQPAHFVRITREIQPYSYAGRAVDDFFDAGHYRTWVREAAREFTAQTGILITFAGG